MRGTRSRGFTEVNAVRSNMKRMKDMKPKLAFIGV